MPNLRMIKADNSTPPGPVDGFGQPIQTYGFSPRKAAAAPSDASDPERFGPAPKPFTGTTTQSLERPSLLRCASCGKDAVSLGMHYSVRDGYCPACITAMGGTPLIVEAPPQQPCEHCGGSGMVDIES